MNDYTHNIGDDALKRLQAVRQRTDAACHQARRESHTVSVLAVSKTWPAAAVHGMAMAGQTSFGENYIQEGVDKVVALRALLPDRPLVWHCIGPIQSNKTKLVAEHFDWVHSVDRLKIAQRLSEQRPPHLQPLQVCVQVNIDQATTKSGCSLGDATALAQQIHALPNLVLRGIMCIPDPVEGFEAQVAAFERATALFKQWQQAGLAVDTLSMGMSGDMEAAISAGSTMVRVGTALFGVRQYAG